MFCDLLYNNFMRSFFYAIILVSIAIFGFFITLKSSAHGNDPAAVIADAKFPYQIIEIKPDGSQSTISGGSSNGETAKIIADLGITLYPEDKISAFPDPKLKIGAKIKLQRAPIILVKDGKKQKEYRSWAKTAGEFLAEKNIELGVDDKANFATDSALSDGEQLIITRVAITTIIESKAIDFQIVQKDDPNLAYGRKRTETGEKGEKKLTYRVRREDGEEVERTLLNSEISKNPKNEIHYTGTKVTVLSSVRGRATMTLVSNYVVSPNYPRGTLIRITSGSKSIIVTVNATWGTASPPAGVVLDLSQSFLSQLKCSSSGCPNVLVEEIQQ